MGERGKDEPDRARRTAEPGPLQMPRTVMLIRAMKFAAKLVFRPMPLATCLTGRNYNIGGDNSALSHDSEAPCDH